MRQHLTPHLEAKTRPKHLARDSVFWAKHVQHRLAPRHVNQWRIDVHAGPGLSQKRTKIVKLLRIVVPDVPEVSCGAIIEESKPCGLLLKQSLIVVNWAENWDESYRRIKMGPKQ